jgi:hypothetical protein
LADIPTEKGWLYLAGYKDIFTGQIVGLQSVKGCRWGLSSRHYSGLFRQGFQKKTGYLLDDSSCATYFLRIDIIRLIRKNHADNEC